MKGRNYTSGFSVIEIMVAAAVFAALSVGAFTSWSSISRSSQRKESSSAMQNSLLDAHWALLKAAQESKNCQKVLVGSAHTLQCERPNFALPNIKYRYIVTSSGLEYQEEKNSAWVKVMQIPDITELILCNDADMAGTGCPLGDSDINRVHTQNIAGRANRFFRFEVRAISKTADAKTIKTGALKGAFYVRNPIGTTSSNFY